MKKLLVVLAMMTFGTTAAFAACPGGYSVKDAKADSPVPQQSKPATRT